ncbi:vitamin K epoxide reductase family protein [Brachybacterium aquaticum]|uniref:Putative membrane protein n=1 Tax=Brachybacterium aquaticum TaxID=1432564 RepID=A0A841ADE7_9MICO|nr:vitamin K epoxide reductase family protein [Brachybacterium aquaticum]MBB5831280.1 putative membrane protein [Brachybacterium aquaticum]
MSTVPSPQSDAAHNEADEAALRAEIDAELAAERSARPRAGLRLAGAVLLIGALVGWFASLELQVGKEFLLANPGASLACDVNPFISCGSVMMTWQSSALGIPNMAIGLGGFAIMAATGALMVSGTALPTWYRWARLGGMTFAFGYIHFLAISAIFVIRALCPWCMVIWTVTAPMFFSTLAHTIESGDLRLPRPLANVLRHWVVLTLLWYLLVIVTILAAFWRQWLVVFGIA